MRYKWLGSITSMLVAAGAALAQAPMPADSSAPPIQSVEHLAPAGDAPPPPVAPPPVAPRPAPIANLPAPVPCGSCAGAAGDHPAAVDNPRHSEYESGSAAQAWFSAEYLLWWIKNGPTPGLVGQITTANARSGTIGSITTIYGDGNNNVNYHEHSGVRLTGGMWLDECRTFGVDASFFQLEHKPKGSMITSPGDPVIGPTFFDPVTFRQTIILASLPTFTTGPNAFSQRSATIGIQNNDRLYGAEINARYQLGALLMMDRLDFFAGFRHLYFGEGLDITTESIALPGNVGPNVLISDHFGTRNQFFGGQFGFASHGQCGRLSFDGILKIGLGNVHEVLDINGSTTIGPTTIGGVTTPQTTFLGGVLAQPTNIGHHNRDQFAVLPEFTLTLGYQVMPHVRATVGYNFLYLSRVLRPGNTIDGVDARQVHSLSSFDATAQVTHPAPVYFVDHFYAQGVNFGLEFAY